MWCLQDRECLVIWGQYQRPGTVPLSRTRERDTRQDTLQQWASPPMQHNNHERPSLSSGRRFPRLGSPDLPRRLSDNMRRAHH